jgi:hypothetical protein
LKQLVTLLWFLAGCGVEVANTLLRHWSVHAIGLQSPTLVFGGIIGGFLIRLAGTAAILLLAFRHDPLSGMAALVGYWVCRGAMVWWMNREVLSRA